MAVVGLCAQVLAASATLVVRDLVALAFLVVGGQVLALLAASATLVAFLVARPWAWAYRALAPCLGCARWLVATLLGCCLCWWRWVLFLVVALALGLPCSCTLPGPCCGPLACRGGCVPRCWPCWLPAPRWWAGGGLLPSPWCWCRYT